MIRRFVFTIGIGNGDAHLKNWALVYPDGRTARLAPAYDYVSTICYDAGDDLALPLSGERRWQRFSLERFDEFAIGASLSRRTVRRTVLDTVARMLTAWAETKTQIADPAIIAALDANFARVPVFKLRQ